MAGQVEALLDLSISRAILYRNKRAPAQRKIKQGMGLEVSVFNTTLYDCPTVYYVLPHAL